VSARRLSVAIYFDVICPWCYIGKRHFARARDRFAQLYPEIALQSVWVPLQLLPEVPERGLPFDEFYERRLGSADAVRQRRQQIAAAARGVCLELDLTAIERMPNTAQAHALLRRVAALGDPGLYEALLERLFAAYFLRGQDIGDARILRALAAGVGVPADRIADVPAEKVRPAQSRELVTGVPHFEFNERLSLSGAQDAGTLLATMIQAVKTPAATLA
jgi:predicted DsbA family dithiol-disulfide isomerase